MMSKARDRDTIRMHMTSFLLISSRAIKTSERASETEV